MTSPLDELRGTADAWHKKLAETGKSPGTPTDDDLHEAIKIETAAMHAWMLKQEDKEK